jgi:hypothetical protein
VREVQRISTTNSFTGRVVALRYTQPANDTSAVTVTVAAAPAVLANPRLGVRLEVVLAPAVNATAVPITLAANITNDDCVAALALALAQRTADVGCSVVVAAGAISVEVAILATKVRARGQRVAELHGPAGAVPAACGRGQQGHALVCCHLSFRPAAGVRVCSCNYCALCAVPSPTSGPCLGRRWTLIHPAAPSHPRLPT